MLALVRALSTHHSMVDIDTLGKMIDRLRTIYGDSRILSLDLRDYYDIIKPGSYYTANQIVIVFRIPIVSLDLFELYRLSIAPNRYSQVLIPPLPFLATNKEAYVYMEAECPKIGKEYLCVSNTISHTRNQRDCTRELVTNHALGETCNLTTVTLRTTAMEQLDDKDYVVTFPVPTRVHLQCGREEYKQLRGSYLITLPVNCTLKTTELTLANENDEISGQPLIITDISYNFKEATTSPLKISLQSVDLRKLHRAYNQLILQPKLERETTPDDTFYHTTVPFYVVLLSAAILAIIIIGRRNTLWKCGKQHQRDETSPEHTYEDVEEKPKNFPATFSLKVGK